MPTKQSRLIFCQHWSKTLRVFLQRFYPNGHGRDYIKTPHISKFNGKHVML